MPKRTAGDLYFDVRISERERITRDLLLVPTAHNQSGVDLQPNLRSSTNLIFLVHLFLPVIMLIERLVKNCSIVTPLSDLKPTWNRSQCKRRRIWNNNVDTNN